MIGFYSGDSPADVADRYRTAHDGTIFEGFGDRLETEYADVITVLLDHYNDDTPAAYFSGFESMVVEGIDIDEDVLRESLADHSSVGLVDIIEYHIEYTDFLLTRLREHCESDSEIIDAFLDVADQHPDIDDLDQIQETLNNELAALQDLETQIVQNLIDTDSPSADPAFIQALEFQKSRFELARTAITWSEEPTTGEYALFSIESDEVGQHAYQTVCKITGRSYNDNIGVHEYDYEVVEHDDGLLETHPNYWLLSGEGEIRLSPKHEAMHGMELYEENPVEQDQ